MSLLQTLRSLTKEVLKLRAKKPRENFVGYKNTTSYGVPYEVVEYLGLSKYRVLFLDGNNYSAIFHKSSILTNTMITPFTRVRGGIGYVGIGKYPASHTNEAYPFWVNLWSRLGKVEYTRNICYVDCSVQPEWESLQNFSDWYFSSEFKDSKWQLDKDILVPGNRKYGPETCVIVPPEVNRFFILRNNKSGLPMGVSEQHSGGYQSAIHYNKNSVALGTYETPEEAHDQFCIAKNKVGKILCEKWDGLLDPRVLDILSDYKLKEYIKERFR